MTTVYRFSHETGELIDSFAAKRNKITGKELLPPTTHASCTLVEPPEAKEGYARIFDRETQAWSHVKDYRKTDCYSKQHGGTVEIKCLGPLPKDVTTLAKPSEWHAFDTGADDWIEDTGAKDAAIKREAAIEAARQRVIANNRDIAIVLGLVDPA